VTGVREELCYRAMLSALLNNALCKGLLASYVARLRCFVHTLEY